jgi:hypothetical protein
MRTPEVPDTAAAQRMIEVMLARFDSDDAWQSQLSQQERMAARKSLESSRLLMGVVGDLMQPPLDARHPKRAEERLKTLLENIKSAARTAYEAGLLLTGVD